MRGVLVAMSHVISRITRYHTLFANVSLFFRLPMIIHYQFLQSSINIPIYLCNFQSHHFRLWYQSTRKRSASCSLPPPPFQTTLCSYLGTRIKQVL